MLVNAPYFPFMFAQLFFEHIPFEYGEISAKLKCNNDCKMLALWFYIFLWNFQV